MALDSRYINISDLQSLFRDKDTGLPLATGKLKFFKDNARTVAKSVFILSGSPPGYTYTDIGNEVTLSSAGTFQYLGNDVTAFYLPYDDNGDIELYYVEVYDENDIFQWSRAAVPYITDDTINQTDYTNYIPNGQFLTHNNLPETFSAPIYDAGEIRAEVTQVAPGGWSFVRDPGASSKDFVRFQRFDSISDNPTSNPRYRCNIECESAGGGGTFKDLRVKFNNVNKFASTTQTYTVAFTGQSNTESDIEVQIYLVKNYGTGGSTEQIISKGTVSIPAGSFSLVQKSFTFGTNENETLGTLDDDYVEIAFRFPPSSVFDIYVTDFVLTTGSVDVDYFPETPDAEFKYRSVAGFMPVPDYDGFDLYLPLVQTKTGLTYDDSSVGSILQTAISTPPISYLSMDGTKYEKAAYSSDGIPYARLGNKLFYTTATSAVPIFGTGDDYFTAVNQGSGSLRLINNSAKAVTATADGATGTGFGFPVIHTGLDAGYYVQSYYFETNYFWIENNEFGAVTAIAAGTSGFTVSPVHVGTTETPEISEVTTTAASGLAGKYFTFVSLSSATPQPYYVWFKVDTVGADPMVSMHTGIQVDLIGTDTSTIVAQKILEALRGGQSTLITTVAGSALSGGEYFTAEASGGNFYVWYTVDGSGSEPVVANSVGIKVPVLGTDTAAEVAYKTQYYINDKYFKILNIGVAFIRPYLANAGFRFSTVPGLDRNQIASFQFSENKYHTHNLVLSTFAGTAGSAFEGLNGGGMETLSPYILNEGAQESRPPNYSFNYFMKY